MKFLRCDHRHRVIRDGSLPGYAGMRGQVLPFVALFSLLLACFVVLIMNGEETISHKIVAQNAADIGALTTATWDARALNTISMLNVLASMMGAMVVLFYRMQYAVAGALYIGTTASAIICAVAEGGTCESDLAEEAQQLSNFKDDLTNRVEDARKVAGDINDGLMGAEDSISTIIHWTGYKEALSLITENGADSGSIFSPTITDSSPGLPLEHVEVKALVDHVEHGRLGGYDDGEGDRLVKDWNDHMRLAVEKIQSNASSFNARRTGPISSWIMEEPVAATVIKMATDFPLIMINGGGVVAAPIAGRTLSQSNIDSEMPGAIGPLQLTAGWKDKLVYLGVASMKPETLRPSLLPTRFPNSYGSEHGMDAMGEAQLYNPYHAQDTDPDLFTPQWRARLEPVDVENFGKAVLTATSALQGAPAIVH